MKPYQGSQTELFSTSSYEKKTPVGDWHIDVGNESLTPVKRKTVSDSKPLPTNEPESLTLNYYSAGGGCRSHQPYARVSYRINSKVKHIHVPGGNINNPVLQERIRLIQEAIRNNQSSTEILKLIRSWKTRTNKDNH